MHIIRYDALRPVPWRNGGGTTREVASFPAGAVDFDWRISIANVTAAGDFSTFPGVDRILTVIEGELMVVTVDGTEHAMEQYRPFRFSGDSVTSCALPVGDTKDLNVMARQGVVKGFLSIVELSKKRTQPVFNDQFALLLKGNAVVTAGGEEAKLGPLDTVRGDDPVPEVLGRGFLAVITLEAVPT
ncbi:HutD family protein [Cryobacterium sp. Y62]|uniref:HutD/Ves family protein n=1 Tax=Cryobacterium sp. Y62 TaxID=2048284 RepID=UPI000CE3B600|nr:HutD family protein [Cryobacterium sp. Y62]